MVTFDPAWSVVFDAAVCAALLWLAYALSRRRPFSGMGAPVLIGAAALLCVPVLVVGKLFSLIVSLIVVPCLVIVSYNDTEQPLPKRYRRLLAAARILVFLLVIACLLRPRLTFEQVDIHRSCAVVLADTSASMEAKDCADGRTRYETLNIILKENEEAIEDIRRECDYRFATFAETFERTEQLPDKPTGLATNLATAFVDVMRDLGGAKAAGIVLISDGRNTGPADPVAAAARLGVPVFAVGLGAAKGSSVFADSSIQHVDCPERVFLENIAPVRVRVAYAGAETNKLVEVTLTVDGKKIGSRRITMPKPGTTADVDLEYVPETEGIKKLVVTVTPADRDANVRNNTKELFVRASESALRVLLVEGEVRWEYKFLRRAIAGAANIKLVCINAFLAAESDRSKLLPADKDGWSDLSLLVLGDIPASRFSEEQLEQVQRFVAEGGALLMLGGFNTLGPGGYGSTPVAKILPVDVEETDTQTLDALRVVPTEEGLEHNILAFGRIEETKKIWATLPPVSGYTKVSGVKPLARVLVEMPNHDPILVVQEYEKGRTAVFAADTTWRWIFNEGKFARYHKAFWRQLVQWLTKSGYGGIGGGIWCETDRLRYLTGDTPVLTVRASGAKVENADITAVVDGPGMKISMPIGKGAGQYELGLPKPVMKSGGYEVTVTAKAPGRKDLQAKTKFVAQEIDVENDNPGADPDMLKKIAEDTKGRFFERKDAGKAFDAILERRMGARIVRSTYRRLWDNAYIYFALCGLLCAEWIARKRKGLA